MRWNLECLTAGLGNLAQAFRGRGGADGEIESSTGIGRGFGPDFAMMAAQNSLRDGQTCTGALKLLWRVQSLKHAKKPIGIFHVKTYAVITDKDDRGGIIVNGPDFDNGMSPGPG